MRTEKFKGVLLSTLVIALLMAAAMLFLTLNQVSAISGDPIPHDPIYIDGNEDFTPANGVTSGSGTENDPYIIENWDIDALSADGIELRNTTAHFIIRNCCVHGGGASCNGIHLDNVVNGRIENNTMGNNWWGISLYSSSKNTVTNNACRNNIEGIRLYNTVNSLIANCIVENNQCGIYLEYSSNNILDNNTCENNEESIVPLLSYSDNNDNNTCEDNSTGIHLTYSDNNTVANNTCSNNTQSIHLSSSDYNSISNNTCENNKWGGIGICTYNSHNNTLDNNICENNDYYGIFLGHSYYNILSNNTCRSNYYRGIYLLGSGNNTLDTNTCENNNSTGIYLFSSSNNNTLTNNTCENNNYGINLSASDNNLSYHNNVISNFYQAIDGGPNFWDDGYPSGGNYWSDYAGVDENHGPNQDIPGPDGIGDTPYDIPGGNQDRYPLMRAFGLATLYEINLNANLYLGMGSKLVVKFYTWGDIFEGENVVWSGSTPNHVILLEDIPHPQSTGVQKVMLVLMDEEGAAISTLSTFTVRKCDLATRFSDIPSEWLLAPPDNRIKRAIEFSEIPGYWLLAPSC